MEKLLTVATKILEARYLHIHEEKQFDSSSYKYNFKELPIMIMANIFYSLNANHYA